MRIGIDGNEANVTKRVGIGQYAYNILNYISGLAGEKKISKYRDLNFTVYLKDAPAGDLPQQRGNWNYKVFGPKHFWTQFSLPLKLYFESDKPDIFFSPSHYGPRYSPCPSCISIMDLSYLHFPDLFLKKDLHQLRQWTKYSIEKAFRIFTISEFTKNDIIKEYNIDEKKIIVTYPGYDKTIYNSELPDFENITGNIKKKYGVSDKYLLFVGTLQPRKNILRLIDCFEKLIKKNNYNLQLLIAGKKGWLYEEITEKLKERDLNKNIILADFVKSEELPYLYKGAQCLVLPSLYEGFGIPIIEAMACGCPVVASKVSCIPEITGDAAVLVDPYSTDDIAKGIQKILTDKNTGKKLKEKGLTRVKKFDWMTAAKKTLDNLIS